MAASALGALPLGAAGDKKNPTTAASSALNVYEPLVAAASENSATVS